MRYYFVKFITVFIILTRESQCQNVPGACFCVPTGTCNNNSGNPGGGTDGTGQLVRTY